MSRAPKPSSSFLDAFSELGDALGAGDAVLTLSIGLIDEDPDNPRRAFDEAELAALAATIAQKGLLQPITVRPAGADGRYRLRFGARRFRAAKLAGLSEIRALVQSGEVSLENALLEQMIENDQREGLNTAELAAAVARLLELGLSQADVGRRLARPKDQIAMLASVRTMPEPLKALAPNLGLRTLYQLAAAWKSDAGTTRTWLGERDPAQITQAEARELSKRLSAPAAAGRSKLTPASTSALAPEPSRPERSASPARRAASLVVEVTVKGRPGRLALEAITEPTDRAPVELEDGTRLKVPLSQIRLVRVRPG